MTLETALTALFRAGKLKRPWLTGMLLQCRQHPNDPEDTIRIEPDVAPEWPGEVDFLVRLDDPATLGCLLSLFREAAADPEAYVEHSWKWRMVASCEGWPWAESEGEAISMALVQLAEASEPQQPTQKEP